MLQSERKVSRHAPVGEESHSSAKKPKGTSGFCRRGKCSIRKDVRVLYIDMTLIRQAAFLPLYAIIIVGKSVDPPFLRRTDEALKPIPTRCLTGLTDPSFDYDTCMPPLLNQMVIVAATPKISDALKRLGKRVTSETYYTVDLYRVDVTDLVATYKNKLRVMPQNYTIYSVINEPNQNYSAEQPQLSVRIVDNLVTSEATYVSEWNSPAGGELNVRDIPGTDKFTFQQKVSDSLTLTRSYYRHVPIDGNIRGILIQYHGWRNTCESFEEESQMTAIADKHGLMLIHACGSEYGFYSSYFKYIHGWNAGTCCIQRDDINDVEYTRMILARENHNHLPVYGYGYSNGGMMVEALLCHKVIDMAVSVNGVLALHPGLQGSLKTCDNIYSKTQRLVVPSVASIHCVDDEVVPYNGSTYGTTLWDWSRFYFVNDMFPRTNKDMRRWARRLGCERKASHKEKINDWTRLQEWVCPGQERVVSIKRFNCSYQGGFAHSVIRTPDFDPAEWAVNFFVRNGPSNP